ncbi:MAG TPA: CHAT domain-containing protein [Candidatus Aminicenantes bacterium]|nr:MAG: hypothetical protein C0168_08935 [Candidatus Aminicenantes bacterium]HEK85249.1 CHAT domain-containing protein [Candidatus Aminicenantes bacterium]
MEKRGLFVFLAFRVIFLLGILLGSAQFFYGENQEIASGQKNWQKGQWLREQGRYEESIKILEDEIHNKSYETRLIEKAICWQNIALDYWNLGEIDKAQNSFFFIQALLKDKPNEPLNEYASTAIEIIKLYKEAKAKRLQEKYQESEQLFLRAIQLSHNIGLKELELKILRQISFVYLYQTSFQIEKFYKTSQEALKIAKDINHFFEISCALNQLGFYYSLKNDYKKAYNLFFEAANVAEKSGKLDKIPECLDNLGTISYYFGNFDLSEYYYKKSLEIYEKAADIKNIVSSLSALSISKYKKQKVNYEFIDVNDYIKTMLIALEIAKGSNQGELEASILNNIGYIYLENNLEKAEDYIRQGLERGIALKNKKVIAASLNNLGTIYFRKNQIDEAIKNYEKSLSISLKIDYWPEIWNDYLGLGQCYERIGKYEMALNAYERAVEIINKIRQTIDLDFNKISFDRDKRPLYEGIIRCLVRLREKNDSNVDINNSIFNFMHKIKAVAFKDELDKMSSDKRSRDNIEELSQTNQQISKLIADAENYNNDEFSSRLLELEYRYFQMLNEVNNKRINQGEIDYYLNLHKFQSEAIDDGLILLDYYLGQSESYCFLISQDKYQIIKLPSARNIENSIELYLKLLADPSIEKTDLFTAGFRIASLLIPPISDLGDKINSLVIIPDGLLNYLPFESLVLEDRNDLNQKKYLVEKFRVSYAPSIPAFYKFKKSPKQNGYRKEFLGFGNPYYDPKEQKRARSLAFFLKGQQVEGRFNLPSLSYTQLEIKEIARLFPASSYDLFMKKKATEDKLKSLNLRDYRILHFACHGLVSENFPQRSCLVFSLRAGTKEDGFLTVREIYNLKLKAELVVLSACETSRGAMEKLEGIIGLPRVFLLSGSQAVVSSLWSVNDHSTEEFMKNFYKYLLAGDYKDEALRKAKLKMIHSGKSHPYYWAPFILTGNSGKIY